MDNKKVMLTSTILLSLSSLCLTPTSSYANVLDKSIDENTSVDNFNNTENLEDEAVVNENEDKIEAIDEEKDINYNTYSVKEDLSLDKYKEKENDRLNNRLNKVINEETGRLKGDWQVAIDTIKGESDISIDRKSKSNKKSQPSASTIKVFIALEAYKQVENGRLSENSIKNDVYYMLKDSDNNCANRLIDKIGISNVDKTIRNITGANITDLNRKMLHSGKQNMIRAKDLNTALKAIVNSEYLTKANSQKLERALSSNNTTSRTKILANLPKNAKGFNKSGTLANIGVQNDAAVIKTGNSQYALSVLSDFPHSTSWTDGPQFTTLRNLGRRTAQEFDLFNKRVNSYRIIEEDIQFDTKEVLNHKEDKSYRKTINKGSKGKISKIIFKDPNTGKESIVEEVRRKAIDRIIEIGTNRDKEERERKALEKKKLEEKRLEKERLEREKLLEKEKTLNEYKDQIIKELKSYNITSDLFLGQIRRANSTRSVEILRYTILKVNGITKKDEDKKELEDSLNKDNDNLKEKIEDKEKKK